MSPARALRSHHTIRELAAPWCGEGRLGRSPSHQGAFGRLSIILGVFWNGWGPESQHDIFAKYGYTNTPLWAPLPFMLLFPIVVRLVTYFPLLEKKSNLEELGAGDPQHSNQIYSSTRRFMYANEQAFAKRAYMVTERA